MSWAVRMLLLIFALAFGFYIYIGARLAAAFSLIFPGLRRRLRFVVALFFLYFAALPMLILAYSAAGHLRSLFIFQDRLTAGDYLFLYPFWIGLIVVIEATPYFLIADFLHLVLRRFRTARQAWFTKLALAKIVLFVSLMAYVPVRVYLDTHSLRVARHTVAVDGLPEALQGMTVGLISDIQIDRYTNDGRFEHLRQKVSEIGPAFLLLAGDVVTSGKKFIRSATSGLCSLPATGPRVACLGDHDYWSDAEAVAAGLRACGWQFLENQHQVFRHNGTRILITGVTHIYSRRIAPRALQQLLSAAPEADLKILLVHQPAKRVIEAAEKFGYDLLLAGHTHGGQVVFRPFGIPLTPIRGESPIYSGYEKVGKLHVLVTNGIGLTLAPVRYQAPAEVMQIKLIGK